MKKFTLAIALFGLFGVYTWWGSQISSAAVSTTAPATTASAVVATTKPTPSTSGATPPPTKTPAPVNAAGQYKDGTYTGAVASALYGNVQVQAVVSGGKLADVTFLQSPSDRATSARISASAMPTLKQEAIRSQSANVNIVSGATDISQAFQQSLASALSQAQA